MSRLCKDCRWVSVNDRQMMLGPTVKEFSCANRRFAHLNPVTGELIVRPCETLRWRSSGIVYRLLGVEGCGRDGRYWQAAAP